MDRNEMKTTPVYFRKTNSPFKAKFNIKLDTKLVLVANSVVNHAI